MRLNLSSSALHCCSMRGEPLQGPSVDETCFGCTATRAMRQYASKKGSQQLLGDDSRRGSPSFKGKKGSQKRFLEGVFRKGACALRLGGGGGAVKVSGRTV